MNETKPVIYLLHGDDHFGLMSFVESLTAKMGDPTIAQMNINRFQAGIDTDSDIKSACLAIPFLTERRLVILTGLVERAKKPDVKIESSSGNPNRDLVSQKEILDFFGSIPTTTALVLVVEDEWVRGKGEWGWRNLPEKHWLMKWVKENQAIVWYRLFALPRGRDMVDWINTQVRKMNGQITPSAAQALAEAIGNDTQLAHHELIKLLTYVDYERAVELKDIELLTIPAIKQTVFDMVDAIGRRDVKRSLETLHELLTESAAEELMGMIIRQFRLLIIVREVLGTAMSLTEICELVRLPAGLVEKLINQARGYYLTELRAIYQRLLELDLSNKTSQMPSEVALDTFIISLATKEKIT